MAGIKEGIIKHSTLTDPNLHEPKGIATADEGSVYFATGTGTGEYRVPTIKDLQITKAVLTDNKAVEIPVVSTLDLSLLAQSGQGNLEEALSLTEVNKNTKIMALKVNELTEQNAKILEQVESLNSSVDAIIQGLRKLNLAVGA